MCHLCHKLERLRALDSKATRPIFSLMENLHGHIEPQVRDMWLWRHDGTIKLRGLLKDLHGHVPSSTLEALLDDVNREIVRIKKHIPDSPPLVSTAQRGRLSPIIPPSQSSNIRCKQVVTQREIDKDLKRPAPSGELFLYGKLEVELSGSDIDTSEDRIEHSIERVQDWFRRCDDLFMDSDWEESDTRSLVSDCFGDIRACPAGNPAAIWRKLKCAMSVFEGETMKSRCLKHLRTYNDNDHHDHHHHKTQQPEKEDLSYTSLISTCLWPESLGSTSKRSLSSSNTKINNDWTTFPRPRRKLPRPHIEIRQTSIPAWVWLLLRNEKLPRLRKETRHLPRKQDNKINLTSTPHKAHPQLGRLSEDEGRPRSSEGTREEPKVSEAILRSRRRRTERAAKSVPCVNRYRYEERARVWSSQQP